MLGILAECELVALDEGLLIFETMPVYLVRLAGLISFLLTLTVITAASPVRAQQLGPPADSGDIVFLSDEQPAGSWMDYLKSAPRVALRDDWHASFPTPGFLAESQVAVPSQSNDLLTLPPPASSTANDTYTPFPCDPCEESKEEEKSPVPDLAKGILILTNDGDLTFKPGLRIQPRYMYEDGNGNNDFFIRRFRLKAGGNAYDIAKYYLELKIDSDGRFAATPSARVENAWLDFPWIEDFAYFRFGLYDVPFSRNALTSDSKLLLMDRSLIKQQVTAVGMADNGIGVMLHGRPIAGRLEYAVGLLDSVVYERFGAVGTRESDNLMPIGRVVLHLLDPATPPDGYADYRGSYIGQGQRLEIGANAGHLSEVLDGLAVYDVTAWGVDLFFNTGPYTFQAEYDHIFQNVAGATDIDSDGWYVQGGYLLNPCDPCVELAVRYQELNPLIGDPLRWTTIGINFYIREHNLKVQTDYQFRSDTVGTVIPGGLGLFDENVFQVQLQLDF